MKTFRALGSETFYYNFIIKAKDDQKALEKAYSKLYISKRFAKLVESSEIDNLEVEVEEIKKV